MRALPNVGLAALGLKLPSLALDVRELARVRGVDPDKFTLGLGCDAFSVCDANEDAVSLAAAAAERALSRWDGDRDKLGMIAVGTETAADMSRPLSAFVADRLGLRGAVRSYEVKHACYGGTLALRQAVEWKASGASGGRAALVIAADVARYTPDSPAEPTQGAGAVAMIVDEGRVASVDVVTHAWSAPAFDFWRPVGEAYPRVDGPLSLACYNEAAIETFRAWVGDRDPRAALAELVAACFHTPFPKMVRKAVAAVASELGLSGEELGSLWDDKVFPTMGWNRQSGNSYTASLWVAVAHALRGRAEGERLLAFSYGSGFGAELLQLTAGPDAAEAAWAADVEADLAGRTWLDGEAYLRLREGERAA